MSAKEIARNHIIESAVEGKCTIAQAAERLNLSERRIKQLKKEYKLKGSQALIHGNANRPSPRRTPDELAQRILGLRRDEPYSTANFLHFQELLQRYHNIDVPYTTLHRILTTGGEKSPKTRRTGKGAGHKTRERRGCEGALLQADATPFDWLGMGERFALHGFIDDATGKITGLYLAKNECLMGYLEVLRQTLMNYGIPQALYPDRCGVFFVNPKKTDQLSIEEELSGVAAKTETQFGRIVRMLGMDMFPAHSPQAKGRIERLWETLQSRLSVELALAGIKTIDAANAFLSEYIPHFNATFAVLPAERFSAYVPLPPHYDLDRLLCAEITRSLSSGSTVSIAKAIFRIEHCELPAKSKVSILFSEKHGVRAWANGRYFPIVPLNDLPLTAGVIRTGDLPKVIQVLLHKFLFADAKAA
jgi:transposase